MSTNKRTKKRDPVVGYDETCKGWSLYFPDETYTPESKAVNRMKYFKEYMKCFKNELNREEIEICGYVPIDAVKLVNNHVIADLWPLWKNDCETTPEDVLACMGLAVHQLLSCDLENSLSVMINESILDGDEPMLDVSSTGSLRKIFVRLQNWEPLVPLKNLKANTCGMLVSVKGTIIRVGNIKPVCTKMAFTCSACGDDLKVELADGKYKLPTKCGTMECRGRSFQPNPKMMETVDWQTIRLQETLMEENEDSGRIPRSVDCELTNDLVNTCTPGDVVVVTGIVKQEECSEGTSKETNITVLYLHANSITKQKNQTRNSRMPQDGSESLISQEFSQQDLQEIYQIRDHPDPFCLLVSSLCPTIYGHEMVKAGFLLGLFSGTRKFAEDKNCIPTRGDSHVLVVGDPGLGKSQMLRSCASVSPRSVYVCGNVTTTSGLTVTVSKDGSNFTLEAGALVLADQGCCCIDEFDKMAQQQHQALLEAMEQQSISIAKAGIVCSLPARSSIFAAANPVSGHYNGEKTVAENLKMGSALLSRFDLVFILQDEADKQLDHLRSKHIMEMRTGPKLTSTGGDRANRSQAASETTMEQSLAAKLKSKLFSHEKVVSHQLMRKYVDYARRHIHPVLSSEAKAILLNFFLQLRHANQSDGTPITTRQLESMVRLTEARARLQFRKVASAEDANDVVEIMKLSIIHTNSTNDGNMDFHRSQHGSGMSKCSRVKRFASALDKIAREKNSSTFSLKQMHQIGKDLNIQALDIHNFVQSLNQQNYILKKGPQLYQLQTL